MDAAAPVAVDSGPEARGIPATIATTLSGRNTRVLAGVIAAALLLTSLATLPYASVAGPALPAFLPIFSACVVIGDLLTAYLLYNQAKLVGSNALVALASGYLFTGLIAGVQLLVFPGVFSPAGLLGAGSQTAVWLWMFWHGGFAAFVLLYAGVAFLEQRRIGPGEGLERRRAVIPTLALVAGLVLLVTVGHDSMPVLVVNGDYRQSFVVGVAPAVIALNAGAVVLLAAATRFRTIVQTWLGVAILAALLDASVTLTAGARFSVGWYVARIDSVLAAAIILVSLQHEMIRLYGEVVVLNRRLAEMASIDGLTGVANRRQFDQSLDQEWRRCARGGMPLSLLMLDVDFFKKYNDALGHPAGDACLRAVAATVAGAVVRPGDVAARYGGEEFVVLAAETDAIGARAVAERIRARLAALAMPHPAGVGGIVTVSTGIATIIPDRAGDPAALVAAADAALYRAKQAGRDRFEAA